MTSILSRGLGAASARSSPDSGAPRRTSVMGLSLSGFNNHSGLRNNQQGLDAALPSGTSMQGGDGFSARVRNNRSRSPERSITTPSSQSERYGPRNGGLAGPTQRGDGLPNPDGTPFQMERGVNGVYHRRFTPASQAVWEAMTTDAGLDHAHSQFGLIQAEVFGDNHRYMAQASVHARIVYDLSIIHDNLEALSDKLDRLTNNLDAHIEANRDAAVAPESLLPRIDVMSDRIARLSNQVEANTQSEAVADQTPARVGPWQASTQLMDLLNPLVRRLLLSPTIQGYTARFDSAGVWLVNSLFNAAKQTVNRQGPAWTAQHLPSNTNGVSDVAGTRLYYTTIKNICKHAREKMHNLLLTGIWEPKAGEVVDTSIPTLKDLLYQIAIRFGTAGDHNDPQSLWQATDDPTRARLAYLRREAVRIYQIGRGSSSIWACADRQLDKLSGSDPNYTVAFYNLVYRDDRNIFQSGVMWQNIKNNVDFALPDEEAIQAAMQQADPPMDSQAQH
ncbi:hypothetical protein DFH28DRAFT_1223283 [Melampsora americana]|nr:hypothetical protein DFH28DRAFT_1223283 [Melampsora americana]